MSARKMRDLVGISVSASVYLNIHKELGINSPNTRAAFKTNTRMVGEGDESTSCCAVSHLGQVHVDQGCASKLLPKSCVSVEIHDLVRGSSIQ